MGTGNMGKLRTRKRKGTASNSAQHEPCLAERRRCPIQLIGNLHERIVDLLRLCGCVL